MTDEEREEKAWGYVDRFIVAFEKLVVEVGLIADTMLYDEAEADEEEKG